MSVLPLEEESVIENKSVPGREFRRECTLLYWKEDQDQCRCAWCGWVCVWKIVRGGKFRECFRFRHHRRLRDPQKGQHWVRPLADWLLLLSPPLPEKERLGVCPPEVDEGTIYRASQSTL